MKKTLIAVLVVLLCTFGVLLGCGTIRITGSGNPITEDYNFSNFTKVEAHNGFQVELTKSSIFSIEITVDDNVIEDLEVSKSGDTLSIQLKGTRIYNSVTLRAVITMPDLYKVDLSGGSRASITGFSSSHDFSVELSGGSRVSGDITTANANFDLSGGSRVDLSGSADDLAVHGSGGSQLDLETFPVDKADINLSGGSRATVNVNGTIDLNLSGGSRVTYVGEPTMGDIDLSGDSTISKK
ncbi:head GIN domain-containing protein [Chloroflexota bacterium]